MDYTPGTLRKLPYVPRLHEEDIMAHADAWQADRKRLLQYGQHLPGCMEPGLVDEDCACGWREARMALAPSDTSQAKSPEGNEWPPKRLVIDGDNDPVRVPYENLCPECNRVTNGRRCAHCQGE
ncbi:MAG: hypothetical protein WC935_00120 [Thermoleophilia bacterium]